MTKVPEAARRLRLACIYLPPEDRARFEAVTARLGWPKKAFAQQCLGAFLKRYRSYYVSAALADAAARGMSEQDYYRALRDDGPTALKPYPSLRPPFGVSPLAEVPEVAPAEENQINYNSLTLGGYNFALARAVLVVEGGSLTQLISRIVVKHFLDYWASNYLPQLELDERCLFLAPSDRPE